MCDNNEGATDDAGTAQSCDGTPDDEGVRVWCYSTEQGAKLEYRYGDNVYPLDRQEGIDFAKEQLSRSSSLVKGECQKVTPKVGHTSRYLDDEWNERAIKRKEQKRTMSRT
jgi:hypothetical protein